MHRGDAAASRCTVFVFPEEGAHGYVDAQHASAALGRLHDARGRSSTSSAWRRAPRFNHCVAALARFRALEMNAGWFEERGSLRRAAARYRPPARAALKGTWRIESPRRGHGREGSARSRRRSHKAPELRRFPPRFLRPVCRHRPIIRTRRRAPVFCGGAARRRDGAGCGRRQRPRRQKTPSRRLEQAREEGQGPAIAGAVDLPRHHDRCGDLAVARGWGWRAGDGLFRDGLPSTAAPPSTRTSCSTC